MSSPSEEHKIGDLVYHNYWGLGYIATIASPPLIYEIFWTEPELNNHSTFYNIDSIDNFKKRLKEFMEDANA